MVFQPTPWQSAAYCFEDRRQDLVRALPDDMWLIPKTESTDRQDRIEMTAYKGFDFKQSRLGPPFIDIAPPIFLPPFFFSPQKGK